MFEYFIIRLVHARDILIADGFRSLLNESVYWGREAIPLEKDLKMALPRISSPMQGYLRCTEIDSDLLNDLRIVNRYGIRKLKAAFYIKKGYRGFGLMRESEMIADMWFYSPAFSPESSRPAELKWLGIACENKQAYVFDMFLNPDMRGHNISTYFQCCFLRHLQEMGMEKAYGYLWADNRRSLWLHRLLKWKEFGKIRVHRFIVFIRAEHPGPRERPGNRKKPKG